MRKIRRVCIVLSLLLVLSFFLVTPASAAGLINSTQNNIADTGSLRISWTANTVCTTFVDRGTLSIYIQRYISGVWYTVSTDSDTEYNDILITDGGNVYVSTSGQYRIKSIHRVVDAGVTQATTRTSGAISVN
jgi:hypothetical protein